PVALLVVGGEADAEGLAQRHADEALDLDTVVVAVNRLCPVIEVAARDRGDDRDRAAVSIAAEQGSLRPALNLDALQVDDRLPGLYRPALVHIVDIEADRRIAVARDVFSAHAANGRTRVEARLAELE